ncbi:MAG: hypothetical protein JOZ78_00425, partial [Chroococcidiopsidaceae cyanobacterium CP_BM_ER_R8_30]|nr:hypothetical protein [Chroococcidiopsidaceae cyanobacterium CP_BM_ER_R8_30]
MKLLPLEKLGAREVAGGVVEFGIFLPWVSASNGNQLWVKIIHEKDQFLQDIAPNEFELAHKTDPEYGDYWSVKIDIRSKSRSRRTHPNSKWGQDGKYVYRYCLRNSHDSEIDWIVDPFAREFGVGQLSAFTLKYQDYVWSRHEEKVWKTPALKDIVIYRLLLSEFSRNIDRTTNLLDYLADLGINCIEIIPVSSVATTLTKELLSIGYFGLDGQFGQKKDLQRLIDAAHQRKLAIVWDIFYSHSSNRFPYFSIYEKLGYHESPFVQDSLGENIDNVNSAPGGSLREDWYACGSPASNVLENVDFRRKFTQDFFLTVNYYWLDYYHVDGFRYGYISTNGSNDIQEEAYADSIFNTYQAVKAQRDSRSHWQRFFHNGDINLIQCAKQSTYLQEFSQTYSNCAWQNETLAAAQGVAHGDRAELTNLGLWFGLTDYPAETTIDDDKLTKTALQYIEDYDCSRF